MVDVTENDLLRIARESVADLFKHSEYTQNNIRTGCAFMSEVKQTVSALRALLEHLGLKVVDPDMVLAEAIARGVIPVGNVGTAGFAFGKACAYVAIKELRAQGEVL